MPELTHHAAVNAENVAATIIVVMPVGSPRLRRIEKFDDELEGTERTGTYRAGGRHWCTS
jgi:hypothetical protein